ncbi:hypothetical protein FSST1_006707 [Fusarium sambucinum]
MGVRFTVFSVVFSILDHKLAWPLLDPPSHSGLSCCVKREAILIPGSTPSNDNIPYITLVESGTSGPHTISITVVSPRDLVLRHGKQSNAIATPVDLEPPPPAVGAGKQRLYSFYRPGLAAGTFVVDLKQEIAEKANGDGPLQDKKSSVKFTVVAPQYVLPPGSINTVYPPNGHSAPHITLPHVVLKDPQMPWERVGSAHELRLGGDILKKCLTPWLAILVFTNEGISLHPDVSRYKWLAHVRHVDTTGMAEAGSTTGLLGERDNLFSVVLSHRTGPLDSDQPTTVIAHLDSIENLEAMTLPFRAPYVGLSSLYSWMYTDLPPNSITVRHAFQDIGKSSKDLLRAPLIAKDLEQLISQRTSGQYV